LDEFDPDDSSYNHGPCRLSETGGHGSSQPSSSARSTRWGTRWGPPKRDVDYRDKPQDKDYRKYITDRRKPCVSVGQWTTSQPSQVEVRITILDLIINVPHSQFGLG